MSNDLSNVSDFASNDDEKFFGHPPADLGTRIMQAANFLKAMSHEGRLLILCHLAAGEKSVTELEGLLGVRQAAVSQQLARLRLEGLVNARRDGKSMYYSIGDAKVWRTVGLIRELFGPESDRSQPRP